MQSLKSHRQFRSRALCFAAAALCMAMAADCGAADVVAAEGRTTFINLTIPAPWDIHQPTFVVRASMDPKIFFRDDGAPIVTWELFFQVD